MIRLREKDSGLSLLEILITLSIISMVIVFSVPVYDKLFKTSQHAVAAEQLMRAIQLARTLAMTQEMKVTLCGSNDQSTCSPDWHKGYIILANNKVRWDFHFSDPNGLLYWRGFPAYLKNVEFLPSGRSHFQNGTFWYCLSSHINPAWAIMLNQAGRARLIYPSAENKIVDEKGNLIHC